MARATPGRWRRRSARRACCVTACRGAASRSRTTQAGQQQRRSATLTAPRRVDGAGQRRARDGRDEQHAREHEPGHEDDSARVRTRPDAPAADSHTHVQRAPDRFAVSRAQCIERFAERARPPHRARSRQRRCVRGASPGSQVRRRGSTQRANPICAASRTRSAACVAPRTSPASPTSPNTAVVGRNGAVAHARRDRGHDAQVSRRLVDRHPAGDVDEHVVARAGSGRRASRAPRAAARAVLIDAVRRAARVAVGAGADERLHLDEDRPRSLDASRAPPTPARRPAARRGTAPTGWAPAAGRSPVISNTPSSLTAPNRFFTARTTRCA